MMSSAPASHCAEQDREARMRFMGITGRTGELLREFWQIAEPALPDILDGFYRHVGSERQLVALIGNDIPRLKKAQGSHWERLFNGRFDHEYMKGVRTIGMVHNKIGLEPRWYIGAYNFVLSRLVALAVQRYRWQTRRLPELLAAVNCAVMLDMEIAISVYQEAMLAERERRQEKVSAAIQSFDSRIRAVLETVGGSAMNLQSAANALASSASQSTAVNGSRGGFRGGLRECAGGSCLDGTAHVVDQRDQSPGIRVHTDRPDRSRPGRALWRGHSGPRKSRPADRRCCGIDQLNRRTNKSARPERHDRGRAGR